MQSVVIKKDVLIETIKANMETHRETYLSAVRIFRDKQTELLEQMLEQARKGEQLDRLALSRLPVPEDHTEDYKVALEMLGHEVRDELELSDHEYRQFMRDEWEWRKRWMENTVAYSMQAQ